MQWERRWYRILAAAQRSAMFQVMEQDTHPRQQARYIELLRAQSPVDRLRKAAALTRAVRQMAVVGIRLHYPQADELEVRVRLTERIYGRKVALRLFGPHPALT